MSLHDELQRVKSYRLLSDKNRRFFDNIIYDDLIHYGYNLDDYYVISDDFIISGTSTGQLGANCLRFISGTASIIDPEPGFPGILRRNTSSTNGQECATIFSPTQTIRTILFSNFVKMTFVVRALGVPSNYTFAFGAFTNITSAVQNNGFYFGKNNTDTNFRFYSFSSSLSSTVLTNVPINNNFRVFEIKKQNVYSTSINSFVDVLELYIDGVLSAKIDTNVPSPNAPLILGWRIATLNSVVQSVDVDWYSLMYKRY